MIDTAITLVLIVLLSAFGGGVAGYAAAHTEVRYECERLGGFYVGNKVFKCEEAKK